MFEDFIFSEEEAQATTEYILILAIVMSLMMILVKQILRPAFEVMKNAISKRLEDMFSGSGDRMHHLKLGR